MVAHSAIDHTGVTGVGGLVLIQTQTASASATLDFASTISSTYDEYVFEGVAIRPATDGTNLLMRVGTGAGPTYDAGSNYFGTMRAGTGTVSVSGSTGTPQQGSSNGATTQADAGSTGMMIGKVIDNDSGFGQVSFNLRLCIPQSATQMKHIYGQSVWHNGTEVFTALIGYLYGQTTALTAIRFLMASGNITSGVVRSYGIKK